MDTPRVVSAIVIIGLIVRHMRHVASINLAASADERRSQYFADLLGY